MILTEQNLDWLLETSDPSVRYRTLTDVIGLDEDDDEVVEARNAAVHGTVVAGLFSDMDPDGGWRYSYRDQLNRYLKFVTGTLSFMSELGLRHDDERVQKAVSHLFTMQELDGDFHRHYSCYNGLLLRTLNRLGFGDRDETCRLRELVLRSIRHDGGYHCDLKPRSGWSNSETAKSCIKGSLKSLLAFAEDETLSRTEECNRLVEYFLKRGLLYRTDSPGELVVPEIVSLRFPFSYHPALLELVYSLSLLRVTDRDRMTTAWSVIASKMDDAQRLPLEKTTTWRHIQCGTRGRANKWVTLYAGVAERAIYGDKIAA